MVEVELKYRISRPSAELDKFPIANEISQEDAYYDTAGRDLLRRGNFLRIRNSGRLDFKLNLGDASHLYCGESSFPLENIAGKRPEIDDIFLGCGLKPNGEWSDFAGLIRAYGLGILGRISKLRKEYRVDEGLKVCIDDACGLGIFMEAERMVEGEDLSPDEAGKIKAEMEGKLAALGLLAPPYEPVNIGYLELYLMRFDPEAYELGRYKM